MKKISRRSFNKYLLSSSALVAFPRILLASNGPKWFHDFSNPDARPSRLDIALSGYDSFGRRLSQTQVDQAEQYLINNSVTPAGIQIIGDNGRAKLRLDQALGRKKIGNHPLLVYANRSKDPVSMETRRSGSVVMKGLDYPSELRVVSGATGDYIASNIEFALLSKKNFIAMSLLENTANLDAIRKLVFSRERGTKNKPNTHLAIFPTYHTDHSLRFREQDKPLEVRFLIDNNYDTEFTRDWFMNKFRNVIIPGMTRGRIKARIRFADGADFPDLLRDIDPLTMIGYWINGNHFTTSDNFEDEKTHVIDRGAFGYMAVEPSDPDGNVRFWEWVAVQEPLQAMGILGEPQDPKWSENNPNSFGRTPVGYTGRFPTELDYACGEAAYSQQPGTKLKGSRLVRKIKLKNYTK